MAKVKCPHERGPDLNESEAIAEVSGDEFGRGWEDHAEGGSRKGWTILPAGQADMCILGTLLTRLTKILAFFEVLEKSVLKLP